MVFQIWSVRLMGFIVVVLRDIGGTINITKRL